jgi:small subunit ribosomal protein S4e
MSNHLKRYKAPNSWKIKRKKFKYITRSKPGPHNAKKSQPLNVLLRDTLKIAMTNREVKFMLENKEVLVDGKRRKETRFPVGLFDVISLPEMGEHLRIYLDKKGKLDTIKIPENECNTKICRINGKKALKGKIQLTLHDGRNILTDQNDLSVGDCLLITFNKKVSIKAKIPLEKGSAIFLVGGKHIGHIGTVEDIVGNRILYKSEKGDTVETLKKYAYAVGKGKPSIKLN